MLSGTYADVVFHCLLEIPPEYPTKAPSLYFKTAIRYQNGAQTEVPGKGTSVCLDLLGNFAQYHGEWGSSASGWSPANTIQTVLIQLQGCLGDMLSSSDVENARAAARKYVCSCGHKGESVATYHPPVAQHDAKPPTPEPAIAGKKGRCM